MLRDRTKGTQAVIHKLKTLPSFFQAVAQNKKRFEIRKNDRDFQVGDYLILQEWDGENYTEEECNVKVTYLTDFGQRSGWVVMGITQVIDIEIEEIKRACLMGVDPAQSLAAGKIVPRIMEGL
jgi:hypothetical protein